MQTPIAYDFAALGARLRERERRFAPAVEAELAVKPAARAPLRLHVDDAYMDPDLMKLTLQIDYITLDGARVDDVVAVDEVVGMVIYRDRSGGKCARVGNVKVHWKDAP